VANEKINIENQEKRENMEIKEIFFHKSQSKRRFRNGFHSLLYGELMPEGELHHLQYMADISILRVRHSN